MRFSKQSLATLLVGIALAASAAPALADAPPAPLSSNAAPALSRRDLTEQERQVIASRGIGAPDSSATADSTPVAHSGGGFDWGAVGVIGALIALVVGMAIVVRTRLTPKGRLS